MPHPERSVSSKADTVRGIKFESSFHQSDAPFGDQVIQGQSKSDIITCDGYGQPQVTKDDPLRRARTPGPSVDRELILFRSGEHRIKQRVAQQRRSGKRRIKSNHNKNPGCLHRKITTHMINMVDMVNCNPMQRYCEGRLKLFSAPFGRRTPDANRHEICV